MSKGYRHDMPWQEKQKLFPTDPAYTAPRDAAYTMSHGAYGESSEEQARKASAWRATNPPTKFYDGFRR